MIREQCRTLSCIWIFVPFLALFACSPSDPEVGAAAEVLALPERMFLAEAQELEIAQIRMAQLATNRSRHPGVRQHADAVIQDCEVGLEQLREIVAKTDMSRVEYVSPLTESQINRLTEVRADFDRAFVDAILAIHRRAYDFYRSRSVTLPQGESQQYAAGQLPAAATHVAGAERLQDEFYSSP